MKSEPKRDPRKFRSKLVAKVVALAESIHIGKVITYASDRDNPKGLLEPGGQCSCCGAGPRVEDEYDWCLVFRGGLCDADGVYMGMLCGLSDGSGCLGDIRADEKGREPNLRDMAAEATAELLGDDIDGAEAMMDDFDYMGLLDEGGL